VTDGQLSEAISKRFVIGTRACCSSVLTRPRIASCYIAHSTRLGGCAVAVAAAQTAGGSAVVNWQSPTWCNDIAARDNINGSRAKLFPAANRALTRPVAAFSSPEGCHHVWFTHRSIEKSWHFGFVLPKGGM
jgi:hypothetical protein